MTETVIDGMRLTLSVPASLPMRVADPDGAEYNPLSAEIKFSMENVGAVPIAAPLDEIGNGLVRVYATEAAEAPIVDNVTPPPPEDGKLIALAPGEVHVVRMDLGWPGELISPTTTKPTVLTVCLKWEAGWLRAQNYAPGAVQWNPSFEICESLAITAN